MDAVQFDNFMQHLNSVVFSDDKLRLLGSCGNNNWYDGPQAVAVANVFANSDDKKKAVAIMNFHLLSITCNEAAEIIRTTSFVDDKFAILERLLPKLTDRDSAGEQEIVDAFPFTNDKSKAQKVFAAVPASTYPPFTSGSYAPSPPGGGYSDIYPGQGSPAGLYTSAGGCGAMGAYPAPMAGYPLLGAMPNLQGAYPAMASLYGPNMYSGLAQGVANPYAGYAIAQPSQALYQGHFMNPSINPSMNAYPYFPGNA